MDGQIDRETENIFDVLIACTSLFHGLVSVLLSFSLARAVGKMAENGES